jgi:hypothetical protein
VNGIFDNQTSGNDWTPVVGSMLHERQQDQPEPEIIGRHRNIIENLEREMSRYEEDHQTMVKEVSKSYMMPRDNSVQDFLHSHRVLPQLLMEALPRLQEIFGDATVFTLRAASDEYGWQNLFVDALWPGDAADAYADLDRFEDEWWVANCHVAGGHLNFTYRLV